MKHFYWTFFLLILFVSCQSDPIPKPDSVAEIMCIADLEMEQDVAKSGTVTVGARQVNPFTLTNMQKALISMKLREGPAYLLLTGEALSDLIGLGPYNLSATHYHIKITPRTLEEWMLLDDDDELDLYPFPIDSKIIGEGTLPQQTNCDTGADEENLNTLLRPLYACIPISKQLPAGMQYQILDKT